MPSSPTINVLTQSKVSVRVEFGRTLLLDALQACCTELGDHLRAVQASGGYPEVYVACRLDGDDVQITDKNPVVVEMTYTSTTEV